MFSDWLTSQKLVTLAMLVDQQKTVAPVLTKISILCSFARFFVSSSAPS